MVSWLVSYLHHIENSLKLEKYPNNNNKEKEPQFLADKDSVTSESQKSKSTYLSTQDSMGTGQEG